jgi:hypothetical protein
MKYDYTMETKMPISVTMTYRDLKLMLTLLENAGDDDWRYNELRREVEETIKSASRHANIYYKHQTEENEDNA